MNNKFHRFLSVLTAIILCGIQSVSAQEIEMADTMRAEGKIYVVVAVAFIVLAIMSYYLVKIDRKVSKLEKENKQ
ncbi:MAG: CcmD family protein [Bacteroidia bacterium]|nr:CcmD family protein [Bacteroidia bacterium]